MIHERAVVPCAVLVCLQFTIAKGSEQLAVPQIATRPNTSCEGTTLLQMSSQTARQWSPEPQSSDAADTKQTSSSMGQMPNHSQGLPNGTSLIMKARRTCASATEAFRAAKALLLQTRAEPSAWIFLVLFLILCLMSALCLSILGNHDDIDKPHHDSEKIHTRQEQTVSTRQAPQPNGRVYLPQLVLPLQQHADSARRFSSGGIAGHYTRPPSRHESESARQRVHYASPTANSLRSTSGSAFRDRAQRDSEVLSTVAESPVCSPPQPPPRPSLPASQPAFQTSLHDEARRGWPISPPKVMRRPSSLSRVSIGSHTSAVSSVGAASTPREEDGTGAHTLPSARAMAARLGSPFSRAAAAPSGGIEYMLTARRSAGSARTPSPYRGQATCAPPLKGGIEYMLTARRSGGETARTPSPFRGSYRSNPSSGVAATTSQFAADAAVGGNQQLASASSQMHDWHGQDYQTNLQPTPRNPAVPVAGLTKTASQLGFKGIRGLVQFYDVATPRPDGGLTYRPST